MSPHSTGSYISGTQGERPVDHALQREDDEIEPTTSRGRKWSGYASRLRRSMSMSVPLRERVKIAAVVRKARTSGDDPAFGASGDPDLAGSGGPNAEYARRKDTHSATGAAAGRTFRRETR